MVVEKIRTRYGTYTKYYVVECETGVFITDKPNAEYLKYPEEIIFEGTFDDCVEFMESTNII
jgi:hypothetical protein